MQSRSEKMATKRSNLVYVFFIFEIVIYLDKDTNNPFYLSPESSSINSSGENPSF